MITRTCDAAGCGAALTPGGKLGYSLEFGRHGCVTARADLCDACRTKVEAAIGVTWNELYHRNKREDET